MTSFDTRLVLSALFRRRRLFMIFFIPINLFGLLYILLVNPQYESTAKLLVKFGKDARPDINIGQTSYAGSVSLDEQRSVVQSNLKILNSRDLAETLLKEITIDKAYPDIAKDPPGRGTILDAALEGFSKDLVTKAGADSNTIDVSLFNTDAATSTAMLNRLLNLFIQFQSTIYSNPQAAALQSQADVAYHKLEESHKRLYAFQAETGIASADEELTLLLKQRNDISTYMARHKIMPADKATSPADKTDSSGAAGTDLTVGMAIPAQNIDNSTNRLPVLENIQNKIDELLAKKAEMMQTYSANSTLVKNLENNIAAQTRSLNETVRSLNDQVKNLDQQILEKNQHKARYDELVHQVQLDEEAFKAIQARLREAQSKEDLNDQKITQISVLEQPTLPFKPTRPMKKLIIFLCLLAGTALGLAASLVSETYDQTLSLPEHVFSKVGAQVIAIFNANTKIASGELVRLYRTIESRSADKAARIIGFVSCNNNEGAVDVARELALSLDVASGHRALFIDRPRQGEVAPGYVQRPKATLFDVAHGLAHMKDAIGTVSVGAKSYAAVRLASENDNYGTQEGLKKLAQIFETLRKDFDFIALPLSGYLNDPHSGALVRLTDGVVMIVEAERTRAPIIKTALRAIDGEKVSVLGLALNRRQMHIPAWIYNRL
jgi:Mrp family chromosome partitioning ATPase